MRQRIEHRLVVDPRLQPLLRPRLVVAVGLVELVAIVIPLLTVAVLVLSQYVEERYATDLLSVQTSGVGYLLKDRVADVAAFVDAVERRNVVLDEVRAAGAAWVPEFLDHVAASGAPVDFVTTHTYGVDGGFLDDGQAFEEAGLGA